MKEMFSKSKDVEFLAYELKKILGDKIEINYFTLGQEVLTGKICLDDTKIVRYNGIDFNIKYSKGEFLRINVGEIYILTPYETKLKAINVIKEALSKIKLTEDIVIGLPDAFYEIKENGVLIPYCEWAFANKDEYLSELKNNTMFDDADIENLIIFNEEIEKTLQKTKDNN